LEQQSWTTPDGSPRSKVAIIADEIGASIRWATVTVHRTERRGVDKYGSKTNRQAFDAEF